ncbi:MAG TPA: S4 domain-containing protein [Gammaproteobacteria bacterium]|nr:S4 domain-containing protein [Gammaproteobacteria bacterium]
MVTRLVNGLEASSGERSRLDRWLWCARLFKTRSLATAAVRGGKVHVNGVRAKPAYALKPGDSLSITRGLESLEIVVKGFSSHRGPASEAQALYAETPESRAAREVRSELRRSRALANPAPPKRPDKKSRRQIIRFVQGGR